MAYFHREPIAARLGKLAEAGRSGVLRVFGNRGGVIYLSEGEVLYAESQRTPTLAAWPVSPPEQVARDERARFVPSAAPAPDPRPAPDRRPGTPGSLEWERSVREATVDAALELLAEPGRTPPKYRFRESGALRIDGAGSIPVGALLTEVERRRRILRRLAPLLTADTVVARAPAPGPPGLQVSAAQWALLVHMGDRSTPRELALTLGGSVFGTTIEVFRLVMLRVLTAATVPLPHDELPDPRRNTVSFLRAVL